MSVFLIIFIEIFIVPDRESVLVFPHGVDDNHRKLKLPSWLLHTEAAKFVRYSNDDYDEYNSSTSGEGFWVSFEVVELKTDLEL